MGVRVVAYTAVPTHGALAWGRYTVWHLWLHVQYGVRDFFFNLKLHGGARSIHQLKQSAPRLSIHSNLELKKKFKKQKKRSENLRNKKLFNNGTVRYIVHGHAHAIMPWSICVCVCVCVCVSVSVCVCVCTVMCA